MDELSKALAELDMDYLSAGMPTVSDAPIVKLRSLIEQGWRAVYGELFGWDFVSALAPRHLEAVEWHWDSRQALLKKERPQYFAYFPIWARGAMKSTVAERMVVAMRCLRGHRAARDRKCNGGGLQQPREIDWTHVAFLFRCCG